ncbi:uroporphyrinogen-III synthase [Georgenia alba]|uniref:Uroporphyrinogen-III synthase n=1 Tax=Georgenia alba TaxID=2233858 RepID=A0ABW2Q357_9MICO
MKVLLPRDRRDDPLARALRDAGHQPVTATLVRTVPAEPAVLDQALASWPDHRWVAVTSATTAEVLAERAAARGATLGELAGRASVAAVGPSTARALAAAGVEAALVPPRSSAADLVAAWPPPGEDRHVLWPRSARASATLAAGLRERGWDVTEIPVYDTVTTPPDLETRALLASDGLGAVVLTSGSTARALAEQSPLHEAIRVVALGPVTAADARRAGLTVHAVADEQTPDGVVAVLDSLARTENP